ncbi:hypothetical protein ACTI_50480 [Actinoplanes sp. OR16]|uniref:hypothetical protein n=1 Tax=Actinoplanes sp. OR16 TaxID=946334 RepID=UPI000F6BED79|nr:hypothetical protein [Actinoplanes sp. OR16]BBH68363.1 hypothetical protein ACTI_50480 [Actinoplanes sp. OR16]
MTGRKFSGDIGDLSPEETAAFERATDIYQALLAALDAHLDRASDPAEAARLRAEAERYAAEQRELRVGDLAGAQRVIDEYPALVRELMASLAS